MEYMKLPSGYTVTQPRDIIYISTGAPDNDNRFAITITWADTTCRRLVYKRRAQARVDEKQLKLKIGVPFKENYVTFR